MCLATAARVALMLVSASVIAAADREPVGSPLPSPGFHHLHLNSLDPDAAIAFYVKNFPTTSKAVVAGLPALKTGDVYVLFSRLPQRAFDERQGPYWHFGWHVPSAREYWARYRETRAPLLPLYTDQAASVTFSNEWWPGTLTKANIPAAEARGVRAQSGGYGYLDGPDGAKIEFQGDLPAERFNHVHMFQDDVRCAELWYQQHLNAALSRGARREEGAQTSDADCRLPPGAPSWLSLVPEGTVRTPAGGVVFGDVEMNWYQRQGARPLVSSRAQVMDHVGLSVDNLDGWYDKLRQEKVTVLEKPYRLGDRRAFVIEGPSHERIELVAVRPSTAGH